MLLCDDTLWDYSDPETAASFAETCCSPGFETISMRDTFETIYKTDAEKTSLVLMRAALRRIAMFERKIMRSDMLRCALCADAPCSAACAKLDPVGLLRSIWFDVENAAAARMTDSNPCID